MKNYYAFLDVVLDVFYSIILYNAFIAFPGFKLEALLMAFAVFIMLNYWWVARSFNDLPKHYLIDFYCVVVIMFIFSQWSNYFENLQHFLFVLTAFFAADAIYSLIIYFVHSEKQHKKTILFYVITEAILSLIYGIFSILFQNLSIYSLILILLPYSIFYVVSLKNESIQNKFLDNGNQPY